MRFLVRLGYVARKGQEPQVGVKCGMLPPLLAKVFNQIQSEGFLPSFPVVRIFLCLSLA